MWIIILIVLGIAIWMSEASSSSSSSSRGSDSEADQVPFDDENEILRIKRRKAAKRRLSSNLDKRVENGLESLNLSSGKLTDSESRVIRKSQDQQRNNSQTVLDVFSELENQKRSGNSRKYDYTGARFGVDESDYQFIDLGRQEVEEAVYGKAKQSREEWCKGYVEARRIKALTHFTSYYNLESIMKNGLVTRSDLDSGAVHGYVNDQLRLDRHHNSISLSISFPNYKMFYKYRKISERKGWVVLEIDPSVLWENTCIFCRHNAADKRVSKIPMKKRSTPEAFIELFSEDKNESTRHDLKLLPSDPTDPQAEVLVFGRIPADKIVSINFEDHFLHRRFSTAHQEIVSRVNMQYFQSRSYVR